MKENKKNEKSQSKSINIEFSGKNLTSYAGLVPIAEFLTKKLQLNTLLKDDLDLNLSSKTYYHTYTQIIIHLAGMLAGGEHRNQAVKIMNDPVLKEAFGLVEIPHESTIGRYLEKIRMKHCQDLQEKINICREKVWQKSEISRATIDLDSTAETLYGDQEGGAKGFNPKNKGKNSYHPQIAFLSNIKDVLLTHLRPGDCYTSSGVVEFMKEAIGCLPEKIESIFVRTDCGFFNDYFLTYLEEECPLKVDYLIKVKMKNLDALMKKQEWTSINDHESITQFRYKCASWTKERNFMAVRILIDEKEIDENLFGETTEKVYKYFCFVTNMEISTEQCYHMYRQRAECENWIEELKNQVYGGKYHTQSFWANDFLLKLASLALNIKSWFTLLTDAMAHYEEPKTFRLWFIKTAGKLIYTGRKYVLKLQKGYYEQARFMKIVSLINILEFT